MPGFQQYPPRCDEPLAIAHALTVAAGCGEMLKGVPVGLIADDVVMASGSGDGLVGEPVPVAESADDRTLQSPVKSAYSSLPPLPPAVPDHSSPDIALRHAPDPSAPEPPAPPDPPETDEDPEPLVFPSPPALTSSRTRPVPPLITPPPLPFPFPPPPPSPLPSSPLPSSPLPSSPLPSLSTSPFSSSVPPAHLEPPLLSAPAHLVPAPAVPAPLVPAPGPDPAETIRWAAAVAAVGAPAADQNRRLGAAVVEAVIEAGFARYFVPRRWGGSAAAFGDLIPTAAQLAESCASAGWCATLWAAHGRFAAYLPEQGQRDLWGHSPDVLVAAAVLPPAGFAVATGDGWLLRGEWEYASGIDFADWAMLAARTSSSRGPGRVRVFAVPRNEFAIRETWQATGLRGTGSNTVVVRESFVPDHRSLWLDEIIAGDGGPHRDRCHRVPAHLVSGLLFGAPALGVARKALMLWSQWAASPAPSGSTPLEDSATARDVLARTSAEIESAGLLLTAAAARADAGPIGAEAVARNRRDAAFAVETLVGSVERLFRTGATHVRGGASGELERCWRDIHTLASHGALRWEAAVEGYADALPTRPEWSTDG